MKHRFLTRLAVAVSATLLILLVSPIGWRLGQLIQVAHWSPFAAIFGRAVVALSTIGFPLWLAARWVAPFGALFGLWKRRFFWGALWLYLALIAWLAWPISRVPHWAKWRRAGLLSATQRAAPVIAAIENYHHNHTRYPAALSALVPRYLSAVPTTGMVSYPDYVYSLADENMRFRGYELKIHTSTGFLNFDEFFYWPRQNYPTTINNERLERIGRWAYLHE